MIVIRSVEKLPERCVECPCHNSIEDFCQADNERRSSDWRPFWCPLEEVEERPNITFPIQEPYYPYYPYYTTPEIYCNNEPLDNLYSSEW